MKIALTAMAVALAACSNPTVSETPQLTTADVSETPDATASQYTDAEQTAILTESIELVYGGEPQPEWFGAFAGINVRDGVAHVTTSLRESDADLAEPMCRDIAAATYDDNAEPIGVTRVEISFGRIHEIVECAVPSL